MTSLKQIEANRRNAQKSTGPNTPAGKQRSRYNALRHGLTAETAIGAIENADDYAIFEAAIMAEYSAQTVVERELTARLASVLWRLRRATAIETGLFEMQADPLAGFRRARNINGYSGIVGLNGRFNHPSLGDCSATARNSPPSEEFDFDAVQSNRTDIPSLAQSFLRLLNLPNFAFDRLSRYEVYLWRQADQIMFILNNRK